MNDSKDAKSAVADELQRIEEDCIHSGKAHFNAGDRWRNYHYWLGLPSVVLSAIAGAAFLKSEPEWAAAVSLVVTVLTALMTFLKPSERASSHKASGDQYLALRNDARVFRQIRLLHVCDDQAAIDGLDEFTKRRNELNTSSLPFARRDYEKARKGINQGEAAHRVDTQRR
ncbi:MAG: SLATT domain-containing protein [Pseudomonadota bacterium]